METDLFVCEKSTKVDRIISVDMERNAFYPLKIFVDSQIEQQWVDELKTDKICSVLLTKWREY